MIIQLNIPTREQFTDEELVVFCLSNPDLMLEHDEFGQRGAKKKLYIYRPTLVFWTKLFTTNLIVKTELLYFEAVLTDILEIE